MDATSAIALKRLAAMGMTAGKVFNKLGKSAESIRIGALRLKPIKFLGEFLTGESRSVGRGFSRDVRREALFHSGVFRIVG